MRPAAPRMHADEVDTDADLVRRLLAAQFPHWAGLPIERVLPAGTDNALYRLGEDMVVRLPRRPRTTETLQQERRWLARLGPQLPVPVPVPLADGGPGEGYPFAWCVYSWLEGENATVERIDQLRLTADLASFLASLQGIEAASGPPPGEANFYRGEPIVRRDASTRAAIASLRDEIDADAATAVWESAAAAPTWTRPPVWIHGDLDLRNLLFVDGRLSAVVDWGCVAVGDPACDVMVAWKVFSAEAREAFRGELDIDDATWARGRGWALSQAVVALDYYTPATNAVLVREARRWLAEVLRD